MLVSLKKRIRRGWGLFGPSCCCGTCCQTITITCNSAPVSGATVTLKSGMTTVFTGTTNGSGQVSLCLAAGTYAIQVVATGHSTFNGMLTLACGGHYTVEICCTKLYCVTVCDESGAPVVGATVTVEFTGFAPVMGTTDDTGCVTLPIPCTPSGTYEISVSYLGYSSSFTGNVADGLLDAYCLETITVQGCNTLALEGATVTITAGPGITTLPASGTTDADGNFTFLYPCGFSYDYAISFPGCHLVDASGTGTGCITVNLDTEDGYCCVCLCPCAICNTLDLTDSILGSCTLTNTTGCTGSSTQWVGSLTYDFPGGCACPAATVTVTYTFFCNNDGEFSVGLIMTLGSNDGDTCVGFCNDTGAPAAYGCPGPGPLTWPGGPGLPDTSSQSVVCSPLEFSSTLQGNQVCYMIDDIPCGCDYDPTTDCSGTPCPDCYGLLWGGGCPYSFTITITDNCHE